LCLVLFAIGLAAACGATPSSTGSPAPAGIIAVSASTAPGAASDDPSATPPGPSMTPAPRASAAPTALPTPSPWKTYKSKTFHYSISYPPSWTVIPGNANFADHFADFGYPTLDVYRETVSAGKISLSYFLSADIAFYKSHFNAKLLSSKPIKLAGYTGRLLVFSTEVLARPILIQRIILTKGRRAYAITLRSDESASAHDREYFKRIYETFDPD
jgi:hypothetical protein